MPNEYIILPMFAMVIITFVTLITLFIARTTAVRSGAVRAGYFKTYQDQAEPEQSAKLSRHFINLFESPVLFYAVCLAALATQNATTAFQVLAWLYVAARVVHAIIHLGANALQRRIAAYFVSWLIILAMWGLLCTAILKSAV
ncbi:MAG: MAPEG family protein [Pseudomonadota bacterium]